jgi:beta-1,4-mannosyl-glycoprotein beta-1,4-N-acetylglucosaminyltransferase
MYSDEEIVLDTRLNCLNPYVDYFVIIESCFTHSGDRRELNFDIKKYKKFKDKIIYKVYDQIPNKIEKVFENDDESKKSIKYIMNALYRENSQRNFISEGIKEANNEDLILVSDVDEIPNLSNIDLKTVSQKIILFKQNMFCYKFNLKLPNLKWTGTKACQKNI